MTKLWLCSHLFLPLCPSFDAHVTAHSSFGEHVVVRLLKYLLPSLSFFFLFQNRKGLALIIESPDFMWQIQSLYQFCFLFVME